jgi:CheY-like chemotaxis protein
MARVLVVDDEAAGPQLLRRMLRHQCDVCVVESPSAALDLLQSGERYELILYDFNLQRFTGIDLLERLESRFPDQSSRFAYIVDCADEVRGTPALEKPFSTATVRLFVGRMLHRPYLH